MDNGPVQRRPFGEDRRTSHHDDAVILPFGSPHRASERFAIEIPPSAEGHRLECDFYPPSRSRFARAAPGQVMLTLHTGAVLVLCFAGQGKMLTTAARSPVG